MEQTAAEKREKKSGFRLMPVFLILAFTLGAAHLWRAGQIGTAVVCLLWGAGCLLRRAWMRPLSFVALLTLSVDWLMTAHLLVGLRFAMQEPWMRLAAILTGASAVTVVTAMMCRAEPGRTWFCHGRSTAGMQMTAFLLASVPLFLMAFFAPHLLLAERMAPGFGMLQAFLAGGWSAWVCVRLLDRRQASRFRVWIWRLFSICFFGQFMLSLCGWALFSMTGEMHIPVPGVIIAGMIYRGTAGFMPFLFVVSVLLAGAAWCSHLCYFGSWDAWAATATRASVHAGPVRWRVLSLAFLCVTALLLRHAPFSAAVACGVMLGLIMPPISALVSRRKGWAAYCTMICPLGLLSCLLGRVAFWRIRRTAGCTRCGACIRVCRYGALDGNQLEAGSPGLSCTLCRDCLNVCTHGGLCMTWLGMGAGGLAERCFVVLTAAMHALFLFSAMV